MKRTETPRTVVDVLIASDVVSVTSTDPRDEEVFAWADANPNAWKVVMGTKSKAYGKHSSVYGLDVPVLPDERPAKPIEACRKDLLAFWNRGAT